MKDRCEEWITLVGDAKLTQSIVEGQSRPRVIVTRRDGTIAGDSALGDDIGWDQMDTIAYYGMQNPGAPYVARVVKYGEWWKRP